jgi:FixJ family two-component response regulator
MGAQDYIVYVVDDDVGLREALCELLAARHVSSATFGSVAE